MLGTHSEPRRGEMSHVCDISPLKVKITMSIDKKKYSLYTANKCKVLYKKKIIYLCTQQ